jgi:hypothetical protein
MEPVVYYSNHCANSCALVEKMRAAGVDLARFRFFNISTQRGKPAWVTKIPVMVTGNTMYIGDALFALFDAPEPAPTEAADNGPPALDPHDPRARLNGITATSTSKQESSIAPRSSVVDAAGGFRELDAYNDDAISLLCGKERLGVLTSDDKDSVLDFSAPVTLMELEDCEPMPPMSA